MLINKLSFSNARQQTEGTKLLNENTNNIIDIDRRPFKPRSQGRANPQWPSCSSGAAQWTVTDDIIDVLFLWVNRRLGTAKEEHLCAVDVLEIKDWLNEKKTEINCGTPAGSWPVCNRLKCFIRPTPWGKIGSDCSKRAVANQAPPLRSARFHMHVTTSPTACGGLGVAPSKRNRQTQ